MTANVNVMGDNPECVSCRMVEAQDEFMYQLNNPKPGADDYYSFIADKKYVEALWAAWVPANWTDANEQADIIKTKVLKDKWWADYIFETWGWTVEEYAEWVKEENKKRREKWTGVDFNQKIREDGI